MTRRSCPLSSRHICCLVPALFAAFLIQSNESLVPIWGTRCTNSQAASGLTSNNENVRCLPTSFFRAQKSTTAVGSSSENEEASAYFFADKDTDEDSPEEEAAKLKAAEVEKAAEAKKAAEEEKAAQERAAEKARLDKIAQQAKIEEEVRIADEKRENMIREWTDKTVESVEKVIVSKPK